MGGDLAGQPLAANVPRDITARIQLRLGPLPLLARAVQHLVPELGKGSFGSCVGDVVGVGSHVAQGVHHQTENGPVYGVTAVAGGEPIAGELGADVLDAQATEKRLAVLLGRRGLRSFRGCMGTSH